MSSNFRRAKLDNSVHMYHRHVRHSRTLKLGHNVTWPFTFSGWNEGRLDAINKNYSIMNCVTKTSGQSTAAMKFSETIGGGWTQLCLTLTTSQNNILATQDAVLDDKYKHKSFIVDTKHKKTIRIWCDCTTRLSCMRGDTQIQVPSILAFNVEVSVRLDVANDSFTIIYSFCFSIQGYTLLNYIKHNYSLYMHSSKTLFCNVLLLT